MTNRHKCTIILHRKSREQSTLTFRKGSKEDGSISVNKKIQKEKNRRYNLRNKQDIQQTNQQQQQSSQQMIFSLGTLSTQMSHNLDQDSIYLSQQYIMRLNKLKGYNDRLRKSIKDNQQKEQNKQAEKPKLQVVQEKTQNIQQPQEDNVNKTNTSNTGRQYVDHYKYEVGEIIDNRYKVLGHLGDGTFGRVISCLNLQDQKKYALKIIRAEKKLILTAMFEADVLKKLHEIEQEKYMIELKENFNYKQNYILVFEEMGPSLYEIQKMNKFQGFSVKDIKVITKQILLQLEFMHCNQITHTDLKPENILLVQKQNQVSPQLKNNNVKLIDFGNSTWDHENHNCLICTQSYRPPEVVMGCFDWSYSVDIWSLGCIVYEMYTGKLLFRAKHDLLHLSIIYKLLHNNKDQNTFVPIMINNSNEQIKKLLCIKTLSTRSQQHTISFQSGVIKTIFGEKYYQKINQLENIDNAINNKEVCDFVKFCLQIDPLKRPTASECLSHSFIPN